MKDTRKIKLLKSTLNKKLENFRKFRISNIQEEVKNVNEEVAITANNEKTKSKGFFSKLLNK
ncbi:MAG TPA: hypothetical protein VJU52_11330 [Flavobacterium sp.]|nr:hypothetical protein [Flavobacterium sp.]